MHANAIVREQLKRDIWMKNRKGIVKTNPRVAKALSTALISAERLVLDASAIEKWLDLANNVGLLADLVSRARLPFKRVWVEWDYEIYRQFADVPESKLMQDTDPPNYGAFLLERNHDDTPDQIVATRFTASEDGGAWFPLSLNFYPTIGDRGPLYWNNFQRQMSRITMDQLGGFEDLPPEVTEDDKITNLTRATIFGGGKKIAEQIEEKQLMSEFIYLTDMCSFAPCHYLPPNALESLMELRRGRSSQEAAELIFSTVKELSGDGRFVAALITLLSMPETISIEQSRQNARPSPSGKQRAFMAHNVISYPLRSVKPVLHEDEQAHGTGITKRRHSVRGHWCISQKRGDPNCKTLCREEMIDPAHYICPTCGKTKWWRDDCVRGSAEVGFATHDYVVQA